MSSWNQGDPKNYRKKYTIPDLINKFINNININDLSKTKHGLCIIQKCVSEGNEIQRKKLYDLILKNFDKLIKNQFANYLIQYILINTKSKEQFDQYGIYIIQKALKLNSIYKKSYAI
jgi:hypothetical protein